VNVVQFSILTLLGFAVVTFISIQVYERIILPRDARRRDDSDKA